MPGPRNRQKNRSGPSMSNASPSASASSMSVATIDSLVNEIDEVNGWKAIATFLCTKLKLPDLSRRSGLKKMHANFSEYNKKLNDAYTKNVGNEKILGGIIGIWAKMSVDAVLRNRLVKDGLITKIMPLMDLRSTRLVGLEALATVTHHGGLDVRIEIAKHTPTLLRLLEEFPDNAKINELAVTTVSHSVGSVVNEEHLDTAFVRTLEVSNVLRRVLEAMRRPNATVILVDHGISLITSCTRHCHQDIKSLPPLVSLLAACLRVNDISVRCSALASFIRINLPNSEEENRFFDPAVLMQAVKRRFPDGPLESMVEYGLNNCETTLLIKTTTDYQKAMMQCTQDRDMYTLGKTLASLITRTEFSVSEGGFQYVDERTGRTEYADVGLPFKMWTDSLPYCAKILRQRNSSPRDLDLDDADILEIKFHILRQRIPDAIAHAEKAIKRNPHVAYFYYAIGLGADLPKALRAVKKGLKAKQTTLFVKYYMLWRAIAVAGDMGVTNLANVREGAQEYSEGIAFLMSALDDAKTFFEVAPPDARHMAVIVNWFVVLTIAIKGPELSLDLKELAPAFKKLETARQITEHIGFPYRKTQMRLSREMIMRSYAKAAKDFDSTITYYDTLYTSAYSKEERSVAGAEDTLAAWLEDLALEDGDHDTHCLHPRINSNTVALYRCTYCGNPSAALRKCSQCGKVKYCDAACQKLHWGEHKATCKAT
ncbi:hypothetical protein BXZ70DRAFT_80136 [Cristinia sonorae]|uniref:MYND-type domain-containing protein n=1 Tax=Cristinia sonorae TaxID=1940300 RepID=A0A8K0UQR8_9AGAR|nr:hypothetical protein BXZ70DRAFT_80136 [Cristinia sonorae]